MKLIIPQFWRKITSLSILLLPFSLIYFLIIIIRSQIQRLSLYKSQAKIITIGNITVGGSGKTPLVILLSKIIKNHKIAALIRGYKGNIAGPIMVNDNHQFLDIGDEALLLKAHLPTCVAKNRLEGIKYLEKQGYEIIITDDGLQDERFIKDLTIMVIDGKFGFGNGLLIPAGPLRETLKQGCGKANLAIVIGSNDLNIPCSTINACLVSHIDLKQQKFIAFAGIGNPDKFFNSVIEANGAIIQSIAFADHHPYTIKEIEELLEIANKHNALLITTEKDSVRIDKRFKDQIKTLPIELKLNDEHLLYEKIALFS